jgi:hypothetical protein
MAVLAPIPSDKERMATEAKSGLRKMVRMAKRRSGTRLVMLFIRRWKVEVTKKGKIDYRILTVLHLLP